MTEAVREQIFQAIDGLLAVLPVLAGGEYERMPSGEVAAFPALHVFDEGDDETVGEAGTSRWALQLGVDGYVAGDGGAEAHAALNALYADVIETLFAEPLLGGLIEEIEASRLRTSVVERASRRRLSFSLDLVIHYATRRGSPRIID